MPSAPSARRGFSPLDDELELLPGSLTPSLVESITRLGTWVTFKPSAKELAFFFKVDVSGTTMRRNTEQSGGAYVEVQTAQVEALEREAPAAPTSPEMLQMSVDGSMVPLVGGEWAEVKTLAIGKVGEPVLEKGERVVHTEELSYFSRLADADSFTRLATVETHRRGVEKARVVCAVADGAEWEQGFTDMHRPDAKRILDWGHGTGYLARAGGAVFGEGTAEAKQWLDTQKEELLKGEPEKVLGKLRGLRDELTIEASSGKGEEALKIVSGSLEYLEKRREQIRYAEFRAAGYPIGSGIVESANKLVVEDRLKGAGMHWAREHVNPMVALRTIACSDRWEEAWPQITARLRQKAKEKAEQRRSRRQAAKVETVGATATPPMEAASAEERPAAAKTGRSKPASVPAGGLPKSDARRPAADHPWRRMRIGKNILTEPSHIVRTET